MSKDDKWLSPRKMIDYYVGYLVPPTEDAEFHLYQAVIDGTVRVRCAGQLLTKAETAAFANKRWSPREGDFYALPPDIGISVSDVERVLGNWRPNDPRATRPRRDS
jgi:hypothetical protein